MLAHGGKRHGTLMRMSVAAIVLAAGASHRLGRPKQLLSFAGETLLERNIRLAAEAGASPVVAVIGAHYAAICAAVAFQQAIPVLNDQWQQGMATSILSGLNEVEFRAPDSEGVLILSCDQPRLTAEHLRDLLNAFRAQPEPAIAASTYLGSRGVPAIFPRAIFPALRSLHGDKGARALLLAPSCPVVECPFAGGEVDIDLPADLEHLA